jgi:hypothetical protein
MLRLLEDGGVNRRYGRLLSGLLRESGLSSVGTFPTRFRYSGADISYGRSGILAGMIAPPLLARLIGQDIVHHWHYLPAIYAIYGIAAMFALLFIRETRNIKLEDLDGPGV